MRLRESIRETCVLSRTKLAHRPTRTMTLPRSRAPDTHYVTPARSYHVTRANYWGSSSTLRADSGAPDESSDVGGGGVAHERTEVLDTLLSHSEQLARLDPAHLTTILIGLLDIHYRHLYTEAEWLPTDVLQACVHMRGNGSHVQMMSPLLSHAGFQALITAIIARTDALTADQIAQTASALIYLGFDHRGITFSRLLIKCKEKKGDLTAAGLADLSVVLKFLRPQLVPELVQIVCRHLRALSSQGDNELSAAEFYDICSMTTNMYSLLSEHLIQSSLIKMLSFLEHDDSFLGRPDRLAFTMRAIRKLTRGRQHNTAIIKMVGLVAARIPAQVDEFELEHFSEICFALRLTWCYDGDLAKLMQNKAHELLLRDRQRLRTADVCAAIFVLSRDTPRHLSRLLFSNLHQVLLDDRIDPMSLATISKAFSKLRAPPEILDLYKLRVTMNVERIMRNFGPAMDVLGFLMLRAWQDAQAQGVLQRELTRALDGQAGIDHYVFPRYVETLLALSHAEIPAPLYDKILACLATAEATQLINITRPLHVSSSRHSPALRRQIKQLKAVLYPRIPEAIAAEANHISQSRRNACGMINAAVYVVIIGHEIRDPHLVDKYMKMFLRTIMNPSAVYMWHMSRVLFLVNYFHPQLVEAMANIVIDEHSEVEIERLTGILQAVSNHEHRPKCIEQFVEALMAIFHRCERSRIVWPLCQILLILAYYDVYPQLEIQRFYTTEMMECLDKWVDGNPKGRDLIQRQMVHLNRAITINRPDMGIPWFHGDVIPDHTFVKPTHEPPMLLHADIKKGLTELLGGQAFLKDSVLSAYGHFINFVCAIDYDGNPLPVQDVTEIKVDHERLAVVVLSELCFATNAAVLKSEYAALLRELDAIAYRVVQIPQYEWYSMALTDDADKLAYLADKISNRPTVLDDALKGVSFGTLEL